MFKEMKKAYNKEAKDSIEKPIIQEVLYDNDEEEENQDKKDDKKNPTPKPNQKTTMGDIVAKTAIEIYNHYSKKDK